MARRLPRPEALAFGAIDRFPGRAVSRSAAGSRCRRRSRSDD